MFRKRYIIIRIYVISRVLKISKVLKEGLTEKERELLDAIVRTGNLISACNKLGITEGAGNQRLYRLRQRYGRAQTLINEYNRYKLRISETVGVYL